MPGRAPTAQDEDSHETSSDDRSGAIGAVAPASSESAAYHQGAQGRYWDFVTAPSDPNAKVLVWQIVRPEVRQPESRYDGNPRVPANGALQGLDIGAVPDIHFQPGDRITVDAGGCVRRGLEHRIG